jgi:hypothetical protein
MSEAGSSRIKARAAAARAHAALTNRWRAHVMAAAVGTAWRVDSAWVEEKKDGDFCVDLTNRSNGRTRSLRVSIMGTVEACRAAIEQS